MDQESILTATYIGSGCNKSVNIIDWSENDLICFGACNSVAVYNQKCGRILGTLVGHKDKVTCVSWIKGRNGIKNELVSGSADSSIVFWTLQFNSGIIKKSLFTLTGHKDTVLAIDGRCRNQYETIVVSAASDSTVRIWLRDSEDNGFICIKVISTGLSFGLCLNMIDVPNTRVSLLALGTDASSILLYAIGQNESEIDYLTKITGHEDWIRSVDMAIIDEGDILLASSSQDMVIRITRLSMRSSDDPGSSFSLKKDEIYLGENLYFVTLETVLFGHEGWVYSVQWSPKTEDTVPHLLSASFDRTLIIWKPCPDSGVWLEEARMGELGGDSTLGYYGAKFSPNGSSVLAHSFQGSFHLWKKHDSKWLADYTLGGHNDAVTDISWERKGRYIVSVSSDKTTRLHGPYLKGLSFSPWCELSRPQIHGHSLYSITMLQNLGFASCSEEKVVRVFSPSFGILKILNYFCDSLFDIEKEECGSTLPSHAAITALGLSNKACFENTERNDSHTGTDCNQESNMTPNEDFLVQNTLWPEVMKLYGHGNDVFCVTSSNDGIILATASKATTADQAKIILWNTNTWNIITKLDGHQLTVTQMAFSPDDSYLLTVSRDRKWCLFKKGEDGQYSFQATAQKGKVMHSRIIWSCAWTHDGLYFATGSRDCKVIIWNKENPVSEMISSGSVTAVHFGPTFIEKDKYILAVGHDSGTILIYSWLNDWTLLHDIPSDIGHHLTVKRVLFRPIIGRTGHLLQGINDNVLELASCSDDNSVRIYNIPLNH